MASVLCGGDVALEAAICFFTLKLLHSSDTIVYCCQKWFCLTSV